MYLYPSYVLILFILLIILCPSSLRYIFNKLFVKLLTLVWCLMSLSTKSNVVGMNMNIRPSHFENTRYSGKRQGETVDLSTAPLGDGKYEVETESCSSVAAQQTRDSTVQQLEWDQFIVTLAPPTGVEELDNIFIFLFTDSLRTALSLSIFAYNGHHLFRGALFESAWPWRLGKGLRAKVNMAATAMFQRRNIELFKTIILRLPRSRFCSEDVSDEKQLNENIPDDPETVLQGKKLDLVVPTLRVDRVLASALGIGRR